MPLGTANIRNLTNVVTEDIDLVNQAFNNIVSTQVQFTPMQICDVPPPGSFLASINDTFNCNLCPNDTPYFNLYAENEKIYFYFDFEDDQSTDITNPDHGWNSTGNLDILISARLLDVDGLIVETEVNGFCSDWMNGYREATNQNIQVLVVDTSLISETCWTIEFTINKRSTSEIFYSEPYRKINCEETVLVEGEFDAVDCDGRFYGFVNAFFGTGIIPYIDQYRVPANIEKENFELERLTTSDSRTISSQKVENYLFRSRKLPEYVINRLINSFSGKTVKLDGVEYTEIQGFDKNNESGSMWIVNVELGILKEELKFGCN